MSRLAKLWLLGTLFAVCGAAAIWRSWPEDRRESAVPGQLYEVVLEQVSAFRSDDYSAAYRHVSSNFQERYNIEAFSELARTEYPGFLHASRLEFGAIHFQGRHAMVPVYFFLPDDDVISCVFSLVREDDAWKIDGVRVLRRWPAGRRLGGMRT